MVTCRQLPARPRAGSGGETAVDVLQLVSAPAARTVSAGRSQLCHARFRVVGSVPADRAAPPPPRTRQPTLVSTARMCAPSRRRQGAVERDGTPATESRTLDVGSDSASDAGRSRPRSRARRRFPARECCRAMNIVAARPCSRPSILDACRTASRTLRRNATRGPARRRASRRRGGTRWETRSAGRTGPRGTAHRRPRSRSCGGRDDAHVDADRLGLPTRSISRPRARAAA